MTPKHALNALVTGGGGFLGSAVVKQLLAKGYRVRSLARGYYDHLAKAGVAQVQGSVADEQAVFRACRHMDVVFHAAAKAGIWGPESQYTATNLTGTRHVLEACRRLKVPCLVYTSSPSVVFDGSDIEGADEHLPYATRPRTAYQRTKIAAEKAVLAAADTHFSTIAIRPPLIWGPGDNHLIPRILSRATHLRRVGKVRKRIDTVYIDNAAAAHILAAEQIQHSDRCSGKAYFISQDAPIDIWEMIDRILAAGGLPPVNKTIPKQAAFVLGWISEMIYRFLPSTAEPKMTRFLAEELSCARWFNIEAAKRELGYRVLVSTDEGLRRLARHLKQNADQNHRGRP